MKCRSALAEYCLLSRGISTTPNDEGQKNEVTNAELHELLVRMKDEHTQHLREHDLLLDIIRNQSKPQFWREVGANVVGSIFFESGLYILGKLGKCIKF